MSASSQPRWINPHPCAMAALLIYIVARSKATPMSRFALLFATLLFSLLTPPTKAAVSLLPHGDAETEGMREVSGALVERKPEASHEGGFGFVFREKRVSMLGPLIPVDSQRRYHLSASLRSASADHPASANFGVGMYDAQKRFIGICHVSPIADTDTTLLKPVEKGEKELWVADAGGWKHPLLHHGLAFGTAKDGSDLPNFSVSPQIENAQKEATGWKITLKAPIGESHPEGTSVRQHVAWGAGLYWIANGWIPHEWATYSTVISGVLPSGTSKEQFWKGTRYVRILIRFGNWDKIPSDQAILYADNIQFNELPID